MNRKEFGQLLAALRQDLDWTQFELAEYAEVDEAVVSQIERGVKAYVISNDDLFGFVLDILLIVEICIYHIARGCDEDYSQDK